MLENQSIPTNRIGAAAIADAPIDWDLTFPGSEIEINLSPRLVPAEASLHRQG